MYVELNDFKDYLGATTSDDDSLLTSMLERAQTIFDSQTRRTFEADSDTTRYFDSVRDVSDDTLRLDVDLCAITTITNGNGSVITSGQYVTEPRNSTPYYAIKLLRSAATYWQAANNGDNENAIAVTGKWAYSTSAPHDVAEAVLDIATLLYRRKDNANDFARTVVTSTSTILPAGVSDTTRLTIARYRGLI
jgi:hypothetical protein